MISDKGKKEIGNEASLKEETLIIAGIEYLEPSKAILKTFKP